MPDVQPVKANEGKEEHDLLDKKINYLYQSIQDTQNTIRFLDAKASAVLVVHGILIAATASAAQKLVPLFLEDPVGDLFFWTYFAVIICQALSIYFVILCIKGRSNPAENIDAEGLELKGTFFVHAPGWKDGTWEVLRGKNLRWMIKGTDQLKKINGLDGAGIVNELVGEQLTLSFIRTRKQSKMYLAFYWLKAALSILLVWIIAVSTFLYGLHG